MTDHESQAAGAPQTELMKPGSIEAIRDLHGLKRRPVLSVYHRDGVRRVVLEPGCAITVGREEPSDLVVRAPDLSRQHAVFTFEEGRVSVRDLGSTNGTLLRGQQLDPEAPAEVNPGDEIALGAVLASVDFAVAGTDAPLAGIDGHDAFRTAIESEIVRAHFYKRPFAVLFVRPARGAESHVSRWCEGLRQRLRPIDRIGLYSHEAVEILLPEMTAAEARQTWEVLAPPGSGELRLICGIAAYPAVQPADALLEASREAARRAVPEAPVQFAVMDSTRTLPHAAGAPIVPDDQLVAVSPAMRTLLDTAARLARSAIPLLLQGETGSGKEVLARLIHARSPRAERPLLIVNCAGIAPSLMESMLFGHERGAFTGAVGQQKGVFEAASGGTVFLDEVAELAPAAQAALLRVLETKTVVRVGSTKEIPADVRIVAATHRDLLAMVDAGEFRRDLLFRLNAATLRLPPLRERREEIEPLALRYLRLAALAAEVPVPALAPEAAELLRAYAWPGNVREVRNAMERAVAIADGDVITVRDLPEGVRALYPFPSAPAIEPQAAAAGRFALPPREGLRPWLERVEREVILEAFKEMGSKQIDVARRLDLPLRTLQHRMKLLGIKRLPGGYEVSTEEAQDQDAPSP
jgi:DNA-binding NtrC family response regulator